MKTGKLIYTALFFAVLAFGTATWWSTPATAESDHGKAEHLDELFSETDKGDHDDHDGHKEEEADHDDHDGHKEEEADHDDHDVHKEEEVGHDDHDGHSEEETGEDEHGEEVVKLSAAELKEFGIALATAGSGSLDQYVELPGEIVLNADRLAHVVPQVPGIVRKVHKSLGDEVKAGTVMAVIDSRELATTKATFLAAAERTKLAQANFEREERLWQKKVTSEEEYLNARQALAEAHIETKSAKQQLHALGFSDDYIKELPNHPDATYTRYEIRAPFSGTIIEKHLTLGESINAETGLFTIADLSSVWVDINVYQKDLAQIHKGQTVVIQIGHGVPPVSGKIAWLGPLVGEETRTAKARVVLPNPDGSLRPGLFVAAQVSVNNSPAGIVVPKTALQTFEGRTVVFVQDEDGFEPKPVKTGRQNAVQVEILAGLEAGQTYVSKGAFTLKAQLSKAAFGDGHNH